MNGSSVKKRKYLLSSSTDLGIILFYFMYGVGMY